MEAHKRNSIYDELGQLKIEYEKLREECRAKAELSDYLKKSQALQLSKIQQAKSENDMLVQELNAKSEKMCEIRQMYEDLQSSLHRKDLFLQQISSANEKIRTEHGEKILKLENANRDLVLALDEASARIHDLERKTATSDNEIASLKRIMSLKSEKGLEVQKNESKDIKERDLYIFKLEEECWTTKDQLKWKTEQFTHLEEAYRKLQTHFQANKLEWQKEKSALIDEVSSLQASLDAQFRVSESLEAQLRICNTALAHEESRRKTLEIELSESRSRFEHVFSECQMAKSEVEQVTIKRDENIADLRTLVQKKDILSNEMKYRIELLEQENNDLLVSIKDIQKDQLEKSITSSSSKSLRKKLHDLQQLHKKCEAEWSSQMEKLNEDLNSCLSELDGKNISLEKSRSELEDCHWLLEVKDEEIFVLVLVLKAELYGAHSKLCDAQEKSEYTDSLKQKDNLEEEPKKAFEALEMVNSELADRTSEYEKSNLELLKWKSAVENLKVNLEEIQNVQENARCLIILKLHQQIRHLEALIVEKSKATEMLNQDREKYKQIAEDKSSCIESRQNEISQLKNDMAESKAEKFDLLASQKALELENSTLSSNIEEKDQKLNNAMISLAEKENILNESLKRAKDENLTVLDGKNLTIVNLEKEVNSLREKLEFQEKVLILSKKEALHLEALSQANISETDNLKSQLEDERWSLQELKSQNEVLLKDLKNVSVDRDDLLLKLEIVSERMELFSRNDIELMGILGKMLNHSEASGVDDAIPSPSRKSKLMNVDDRTPLTELNSYL